MLSVRVPFGTRSGRASFAGVRGNAARAEFTSPPPFTANFPARAGRAKTARTPLPPFWLRSSPLPTLMAAGEMVRNQSASCWTAVSTNPHSRAAAAGVHFRASAMYSSKPVTCRSTNARSIPPRRSSSAAIAHASTTSVPGLTGRWRSARSAILVRLGSTTTSLAPLRRAIDDGCHVQARPRDVVAPRHDQLAVLDLLGRDAGRRGAIGAGPRLAADTAAERRAVEQRRAEPVEEAQVHRPAGEDAVRAAVVQRHDRLRAVRGDHRREARVDEIERLGPRDRRERACALGAGAAQRC